jgi:hypothetical protein
VGAARPSAPAKVPHGRWKTTTFLAALRHDRIVAPWLVEGPIDGESFRTYVENVLAARSNYSSSIIRIAKSACSGSTRSQEEAAGFDV